MANIIVGGGIAGLLSALYLSEQGLEVVLVEKEKELGGLLRSQKFGEYYYENGTHVLQGTGNERLDNFLFGDLENNPEWNKRNRLKVGVFFNGYFDSEGPCINTNYLDENVYNKGLVELFTSFSNPRTYSNLREQLLSKYGDTFANKVYLPAVQKLFGVRAEELIVDSYLLFMSPRIKTLDSLVTAELKKIDFLDDCIAYHTNQSDNICYYPLDGGIRLWIDSIVEKLKHRGVSIITGDTVDCVKGKNRKIESVHLKNKDIEIQCEELIWSIPAGILSSILGSKVQTKPNIRNIKLFHFRFDREFLQKVMYVVNYDPSFNTFRVTLYDVLTNDFSHRCTVEVLYSDECSLTSKEIFQELIKMNIIDSDTNVIESYTESISQGFPILTHQFVSEQLEVVEKLENDWDNLWLLGRKVGQSFFMKDVMKDAYIKSQSINKELVV